MKWNNDTKDICAHLSAGVMLIFGMVLVMWGFFTPPVGEVHTSVQLLFGQALVYSGAIFGVALHFDNKTKTMLCEIESRLKNTIHNEIEHELEEIKQEE